MVVWFPPDTAPDSSHSNSSRRRINEIFVTKTHIKKQQQQLNEYIQEHKLQYHCSFILISIASNVLYSSEALQVMQLLGIKLFLFQIDVFGEILFKWAVFKTCGWISSTDLFSAIRSCGLESWLLKFKEVRTRLYLSCLTVDVPWKRNLIGNRSLLQLSLFGTNVLLCVLDVKPCFRCLPVGLGVLVPVSAVSTVPGRSLFH